VDVFAGKPFSVAQARAAGITAQMLRSDQYKQMLHSVYVSADTPNTSRLRAEAALVLLPEGVLSHHTALDLWGGSGPTDPQVHLSVRRDQKAVRPRVHGLRVHEVQDLETEMRAGLLLTPPARTFIDLAPSCELTELVTAGDSLVRRAGADPDDFVSRAAAAIGVRGVRLAREAAALVRRGVDSPMESRLRLLLVLAGLPEPAIGRIVYSSDGGWLAQPDLSYPNQKIAIEYDGRHHLEDIRQWQNDIRRRENLEREGWLVRVITANDLYRSPETVVARIFEDLRARNHPNLPALANLAA
jgi:hypothetical protein